MILRFTRPIRFAAARNGRAGRSTSGRKWNDLPCVALAAGHAILRGEIEEAITFF
jgi:hypothetical protein